MIRNCSICNSKKKKILYEQNFYNDTISLMEKYDVCICKNCGFIYADNIPIQEEFDKYYGEISRYEFQHNDGIVSDSYIEHTNKLVDFIEANSIDKNSNILDLGCSTGTLLSILKERGYKNLIGVDPSISCVRWVHDRHKISAFASTISTLKDYKAEKKFDVIVLSAILEHIVDLNESLQIVSSLLEEDGKLIIEIPDANRFHNYTYTPFQQFSIEHINYFTDISIINLLYQNQFGFLKIENSENIGNQTIDPNLFISACKMANNFKLMNNQSSEKNINKYISKCKRLDKQTNKKIKKKLKNEKEIIIWGVGTNTQRVLNNLDLSKIKYFVDSNINYVGKILLNREIKLPKEIDCEVPILIMSWSYQNEIIQQIRDLGFKNKVITIY